MEFFIRSMDTDPIRALKLDILTTIATEASIHAILQEFQVHISSQYMAKSVTFSLSFNGNMIHFYAFMEDDIHLYFVGYRVSYSYSCCSRHMSETQTANLQQTL